MSSKFALGINLKISLDKEISQVYNEKFPTTAPFDTHDVNWKYTNPADDVRLTGIWKLHIHINSFGMPIPAKFAKPFFVRWQNLNLAELR